MRAARDEDVADRSTNGSVSVLEMAAQRMAVFVIDRLKVTGNVIKFMESNYSVSAAWDTKVWRPRSPNRLLSMLSSSGAPQMTRDLYPARTPGTTTAGLFRVGWASPCSLSVGRRRRG